MDIETADTVRIELLLASQGHKLGDALTWSRISEYVEGKGGLPQDVLKELWTEMQARGQTTWRGFAKTYCEALSRLEQKIADLDARLDALGQLNCETGLGLPPAHGPQLALRVLPAEALGASCEVVADGTCLASLNAQQFVHGDLLIDLPGPPKRLSVRLGPRSGALLDVPLDTEKLKGTDRQLFEVALPELHCTIEAQIAQTRADYLRGFRHNADEKSAASREQRQCFEEMKSALRQLFPDVLPASTTHFELRPPPLDSLIKIPTYVKTYNLQLRDEFPLLVAPSERTLGSRLPGALEEQEQLYPFFLLLASAQFLLALGLNIFRRGMFSVALPLVACCEYINGSRLNGKNAMTLFKSCVFSLFYNSIGAIIGRGELLYPNRLLTETHLRIISTALFALLVLCETLAAIVLLSVAKGSVGPFGLVARLKTSSHSLP